MKKYLIINFYFKISKIIIFLINLNPFLNFIFSLKIDCYVEK